MPCVWYMLLRPQGWVDVPGKFAAWISRLYTWQVDGQIFQVQEVARYSFSLPMRLTKQTFPVLLPFPLCLSTVGGYRAINTCPVLSLCPHPQHMVSPIPEDLTLTARRSAVKCNCCHLDLSCCKNDADNVTLIIPILSIILTQMHESEISFPIELCIQTLCQIDLHFIAITVVQCLSARAKGKATHCLLIYLQI